MGLSLFSKYNPDAIIYLYFAVNIIHFIASYWFRCIR